MLLIVLRCFSGFEGIFGDSTMYVVVSKVHERSDFTNVTFFLTSVVSVSFALLPFNGFQRLFRILFKSINPEISFI